MFKKLKLSLTFDRTVKIVEIFLLIVSICFIIFQVTPQIREWDNSQNNISIELLMKLDDKFSQGTNRNISLAIFHNKPILQKYGGKFTNDDLDYYLNDLCTIEEIYEKRLINIDDLSIWFSNLLETTYSNKEIKEYINTVREEDSEYFNDIDNAVQTLREYKETNEN